MSSNLKNTVLERPEGLGKRVAAIFELAHSKKSSWVKEGTGGDTGRPPVHMHSSKTLLLPMRSRKFLGPGKGYMPIQYVPGASTHYVDDYWEDKNGNPVFDKYTPEAGKEKGLTFRPGLRSIYGEDKLNKEYYRRATSKNIAFENGLLELSRYGDDPLLLAYVNDHEFNSEAPFASENRDPTRNRLFNFRPLIREKKAQKSAVVETFDISFEAMSFVNGLRQKNKDGGYSYNESKMNAVLHILEDGIGLNEGDVVQKFQIIANAARTNPAKFMEIVNKAMEEYRFDIGVAEQLGVLTYSATHAKITKDTKKEDFLKLEVADDKDKIVDQLILHFLGTQQGRNDHAEMLRLSEVAKLKALSPKK